MKNLKYHTIKSIKKKDKNFPIRLMSGFALKLMCLCLFIAFPGFSFADKTKRLQKKAKKATLAFSEEVSKGSKYIFKADTFLVSPEEKNVLLKMSSSFSYLPFRTENTAGYYNLYQNLLGRKFRKYSLTIESMGKEISELIPNYYREKDQTIDSSRLARPVGKVLPIVRNISVKAAPSEGLASRNLALWHSHGWYYKNAADRWEWQRARVFQTVEDLWTMSFIVPYITPMLENAGAHVFLPRERDVQTHEIIIDADGSTKGSVVQEEGSDIISGVEKGFGLKVPFLFEGENPFQMGNTRRMMAKTSVSSQIVYTPEIPETGEYLVSVSYPQNDLNVTDAHYTVSHSGGKTEFLVNQTMGGGTWIYLGTFRFEKGIHPDSGSVVLTNESGEPGKFVSADAVRLGGGMGNVVRGTAPAMEKLHQLRNEKGFEIDSSEWLPFASQRPRYQEGARYFLQYSGMPDSLVYILNKDPNDYKDDYQSRGEWVNYLMGAPNGPAGNPNIKGLGIPIDLVMAFHTDAGITPDSTIIGSLMIYDTTFGPDSFPNGQSRWASRDLADLVQTQVVNDIRELYEPEWSHRGMWNKQYSEAARPKVPALLSEVMSHQNFADMLQAQDPRFKFDVCRAFYKGILKFLAYQNQQNYVVQPLPVDHFQLIQEGKNIRLSWKPVADALEPTAMAKTYRIYTRTENGGFDNGREVSETTELISGLKPGVVYSFKVTAVNEGGESFPSEILACSLPVDNRKPVLIVNAFDRIAGPEAFDNGKQAGFLSAEDEGVAFHTDLSVVGEQYGFDRKSEWKDDDSPGFGASYANQEVQIVPGNSFDYPSVHGQAFRNNGLGFISMSDEAFVEKQWNKNDFSALDIIFGEEKTTTKIYGLKKKDFILFTPEMRTAISEYTSGEHAKLFLSGAYVGTDLDLCGDTLARKFASDVLHFHFKTNHASKSGGVYPVNDAKPDFENEYHFVQDYNPNIYKVESPDAIEPAGKGARILFRYQGNNKTAGVCFDGSYKTIVLGFPFETISSEPERNKLIGEILTYWKLDK